VLDAAGGTDITQLPPAHITITEGIDLLRCLSLSNRVLRWYADCCRSPIANTASVPYFPLVGVIHSFMDVSDQSKDAALGPARWRLFEESATGPLPLDAPPPASVGVFAQRVASILGWWMLGLARPTPFFVEGSNTPRSRPRGQSET